MNLIFYFILTVLFEFVIVSFFIKKNYIQLFIYVLLINLFTWPIANFLYGIYFNFYFIEIGVILIESILLMLLLKIKYTKSLLISFLANLASALMSFLF